MHPLSYREAITEDVYGKLFKDVGRTEEGAQRYFSARAAHLGKSPVLAFDSTTISTYSENQSEARQGFNKDGDGLNTIKLLTLYSVKAGEPIAFSKQPGNIPDVISIENTLTQQHKMNAHRQGSQPGKRTSPEPLSATGPNQLWSWDITYLPTRVNGQFYYLYMIMDLYSRIIIAYQVYDCESGDLASDLITDACLREKITKKQVTLHSDNGAPMKSVTMLAKLQDLGVIPSFSRPSTSSVSSKNLISSRKYCVILGFGISVIMIRRNLSLPTIFLIEFTTFPSFCPLGYSQIPAADYWN